MSIVASFMVPHPPLIIPDIGRGAEKQIEETSRSYEHVADMIAGLNPDTIIISTPHVVMYSDYFHVSPGDFATGSLADYGMPRIRFIEEYDKKLVAEIEKRARQHNFPAGTMGEKDRDLDSGVMIPIWFIRQKLRKYKIVRIGLSGLPYTEHYRFGQIINEAVEALDRRVVFIASGDLSQKVNANSPYGYTAEGPVYDYKIMDVCSRAAFKELFYFDENFCANASAASHRSLVVMAGAFDGKSVTSQKLSYQDVTGVGYGICSFVPGGKNSRRRFLNDYIFENSRPAE